MRPVFVVFALAAFAVSSITTASAQLRPNANRPAAKLQPQAVTSAPNWQIAGTWQYFSFLNPPALDSTGNYAQLFGMGTMKLRTPSPTTVAGTFDMGGGYVLDLKGTVSTIAGGQKRIHMAGLGRPSTPTAGWEYDYDGVTTEKWPNGVNQVPAFTGSVIRAKPHNGQPAGVVASFISIKQ